jgi:hypothetical protein
MGNRKTEDCSHLREVRSLASEERSKLSRRLIVGEIEVVSEWH